jgi:CheY-like chemotaxis protein
MGNVLNRRRGRVLWIEDRVTTVTGTLRGLKRFCEVDLVDNSEDAFLHMFKNTYDVILVDLTIPTKEGVPETVREGLNLIEKIRNSTDIGLNSSAILAICSAQTTALSQKREFMKELNVEIFPKVGSHFSLLNKIELWISSTKH